MCYLVAHYLVFGRPMAYLNELATNASHQHVSIVIYSGNDDSLVTHRGSEGKSPARTLSRCPLSTDIRD